MDALGNATSYGYTVDSLLREIRYANGATLTAKYDLAGNMISETDPEGNTTAYEYDPVGRMTAVTDALGNTTRYDYDAADNLTRVTDALGHVTSYTYDALGNLTSETDALGNTVKYSYTPEGWLETVTDAEGHVTRYSYDKTGNTLSADYAGEQTETNTYNELGLLTTVTTAQGDTLFQYDEASRLISVTQPNGDTVNYTYDSHGNRSSMTYPNGKTVSYSYDEMNRLIAVKGVDGETTKYEYDALGRRISTDGVKEVTVYAYDEVGNLTSQTTTGAYDLALEYAYDLSGRMTNESRTENGATLTSVFAYDPLGQLTSFTRSDGQSESYAYDPVGNMTAKTQNGVSTTMRYNAANQLIQSVSGTDKTTYTYDANGNLLRSENAVGARSYAYNALNLLQSFTREDGYTETYTYNANRLLSEIRTSEDLTTTLTWDILYGDGVVISAAKNGQTTNYTYGLERISALSGSTRTEYVYDGRGSVAAEVSYNNAWYTFGGGLARKNVVSKSYSPFGELLTEQTSGFGYNGEYYNAATGMIYLRARFYEPEMNRFSQKDTLRGSILDPVGLNRYLYCQSDPVNFADYNGLRMVAVNMTDGGGSGRRYDGNTPAGKSASSTSPSSNITISADGKMRERTRNLADDTVSYAQAAYQYVQANANGTEIAEIARTLYQNTVKYATDAKRLSYSASLSEALAALNSATQYQKKIESYMSTALRIAMAKKQNVSPYTKPILSENPSVESTVPAFLPCGKGKYGYGEINYMGKTYPIAVPSPYSSLNDGGWTTINSFVSTPKHDFNLGSFLTYGLSSSQGESVYAGYYLAQHGGNLTLQTASGVVGINLLNAASQSINSTYATVTIQKNGEKYRAVITLGSSDYAKVNESADGIPRLLNMSFNGTISMRAAASLYESYSGFAAQCFGLYDVRVTLDSAHNGNGDYAYLWLSDSGSVAGTPIYYQDDKIEVGQLSGLFFSSFDHAVEIPLSTEPFDASEYYILISDVLEKQD